VSLLFVLVDSLRGDVLGCCGGAAKTPTVDRLAAEAALFPRTVTAAPWTVPSLAAMLTGVHPHRLGLAKWEQPWPAEHPSLFDLAARKGVEAASFVFDPHWLFRGVPSAGVRGSSQNTQKVLGWLREHRGGEFVAFVHYWWTHIPYIAKPMTTPQWKALSDQVLAAVRAGGQAREGAKGLYRLAVERFSEEWLPSVLDAVDLSTTWVVLVGDHGESWGERPGTAVQDVFDLHGNGLYDEVLRVPLLIRPPGGGPAHRPAGLARTVDILPTLAELLGLGAAPDEIDGVSLAAPVRAGVGATAEQALSVRSGDFVNARALPEDPRDLWSGWALTTLRHKLIWEPGSGSRRAFDLPADPLETVDVSERDAAALADGWRTLEREASRALVGPSSDEDLQRTAQRLRDLGYVD
jgi:arylsulfatase A-like enzyme